MDFSEDFEEYSDESSDDCGGQLDRILVAKLPVANFDHFDPNLPPVSGEEYLRRVQLEAQNCPEVVVADLDVNQFKPNQTVLIENSNGFIKSNPELMPSKDWQREQVSEFTKVRLKFSQMKAVLIGSRGDRPFVRNRSIDWWKVFCIGKRSDNSSDSESSDCVVDSELSTPTDTPNSNDSSLKREKPPKPPKPAPNLPLLSTICEMSDSEVILVLSYHIKWILQFGFTEHNGRWIYALLVALEKPLPSEVYSTLRQLSRVCSECRHKIDSPNDSKTLIPLNLIICLIGRYFDQNDMTDE